MTGPDLKPCPFCGGNAEYRVTHDEGQRNDYDTIECLSCRAEMSVLLHWAESEGANRNTLTTAWNTRDPAVLAALPEVQALIAAAYEAAARSAETLHRLHVHGLYGAAGVNGYGNLSETAYAAVKSAAPADATEALARIERDAEARGMVKGLRDAAEIAGLNAWKHAGDDDYSRGMDAGAIHQVKACCDAILARADQIERDGK